MFEAFSTTKPPEFGSTVG